MVIKIVNMSIFYSVWDLILDPITQEGIGKHNWLFLTHVCDVMIILIISVINAVILTNILIMTAF